MADVPSDNALLIGIHALPEYITRKDNAFSQTNINQLYGEYTINNEYRGLIPEIVDAWINGTTLTKNLYTE